MVGRILYSLVLSALVLTGAAAQDQSRVNALEPGLRVRAWTSGMTSPITGTLIAATGDSVTIDTGRMTCGMGGCGAFVTRLDNIERFQIGTRGVQEKQMIGVGLAIVTMLVMGPVHSAFCGSGNDVSLSCTTLMFGMVGGAGYGAFRMAREKWREVPVDRLKR